MKISEIDKGLFTKLYVGQDESDRIVRPNLTAFQDSWLRLKKNRLAVICLATLILIILLAVLAPVVSPYKYYACDYTNTYSDPGRGHILGTDRFGRDQWTRLWMGTRVSLIIAGAAASIDLIIGVIYGSVSALSGGKIDTVMQRIIEVLVGIPYLVVVILLMLIMKAGILTVIAALALTGWVNMARLVRAEILKLKNQEFVMAARLMGTSRYNIIKKHLIPNTVGVIVINTMFTIPNAIFSEAFLSFIGIGMTEPNASLGVLINNGYAVYRTYPWMMWFPAIVIVLIMICFSILGDGLRDALDPRMRK